MEHMTHETVASGWTISETEFNPLHLGKYESILCLGNGYLNARAATEERYAGETRCTFVAGTFNRFHPSEVTELPNCADIFALDIRAEGIRFSLEAGETAGYRRELDLRTGELTRRFTWKTRETGRIAFRFRRFVSLDDPHLIGQRIEIAALDRDITLTMASGIDARMTNSGVQHFTDGEKRLYDGGVLQLIQTTTQSGIDFVLSLKHTASVLGGGYYSERLAMDRRRIFITYTVRLRRGDVFRLEKLGMIHTGIDRLPQGRAYSLENTKEAARRALDDAKGFGYEELLKRSAQAWQDAVWRRAGIRVESDDAADQLALRFAQYHLRIMTPEHDNRMNIGAKGMTGEGYKGHTFWDTELFILPYFIWTQPETALSLLEYRYLCLPGARGKAEGCEYAGAMFPWESAGVEDGETTPEWGAADVVTGRATRIWTGVKEQHITSDVAYGAWQYAEIAGDAGFLEKYGYELIFECAAFWASRLEWIGEKSRYEIRDVIGPDEFKEHADNNAYTNHMAHWTIAKAVEYRDDVKKRLPALYAELNARLGLDAAYALWSERLNLIYLPQPNSANVLPQDDTYLMMPSVDLTPYRNRVGSIYLDYNSEQISGMQVSKQADVLLLMLLREELFSREARISSWQYYEPRTLHDSSLSPSTHSVLASDLGFGGLAYAFFRRAAGIDLGPAMDSSDAGIHAAAMGGIWQCAVLGFGGVRLAGGRLRISPRLPRAWKALRFPIRWRGCELNVAVDRDKLTILNGTANAAPIEIEVHGKTHILMDRLEVPLAWDETDA